jgi:uracil-DNA glycosylase family 4
MTRQAHFSTGVAPVSIAHRIQRWSARMASSTMRARIDANASVTISRLLTAKIELTFGLSYEQFGPGGNALTASSGRFIDRCPGCPYADPAIASRGDPASPIVLVGEAPGAHEIEEGLPFVGKAGSLLSEEILAAGLVEDELYIVNALSCRPVPVRPRVGAIRACRSRLLAELAAHPRRVVVTLGATPLRAITGSPCSVLAERKAGPRQIGSWLVVPTVHPAWVLRWRSERAEMLERDLRLAAGLLRNPRL